jgi:hypothetical protein
MRRNTAPHCGQWPYMPAPDYSVGYSSLSGFYVLGLSLRTPGGGPCGRSFGSWSQRCFLICWDFCSILLCASRSLRIARTVDGQFR